MKRCITGHAPLSFITTMSTTMNYGSSFLFEEIDRDQDTKRVFYVGHLKSPTF